MGRLYLEHLGGETTFHCDLCKTYLTHKLECLSDSFQGATGPAFLFRRVVNIQTSATETRSMITGRHIVRDVYCKKCSIKLGWMYEFAYELAQNYKEGRVILEKKLLRVYQEPNPSLAECLLPRVRCDSGSSIESSSGMSSEETMT